LSELILESPVDGTGLPQLERETLTALEELCDFPPPAPLRDDILHFFSLHFQHDALLRRGHDLVLFRLAASLKPTGEPAARLKKALAKAISSAERADNTRRLQMLRLIAQS
ncbi:MAG: hypothetical protein AAF570_01865, partial [Bacteroidota bacterium]